MTRSPSFLVLGSEFNDFLFASIGKDRNDMPLSVLSALARLYRPLARGCRISSLARGNCDSKTGLVDCGATRRSIGASRPRNDFCSLGRAFTAPRSFQSPVARHVAQRRCSDKSPGPHIRDHYLRHRCDFHDGRPMDRRKPSTAGAGRQRSYAGLQRSLPTEDATAELWPVTIMWARSRYYDRRQDAAKCERLARISEAADTFACATRWFSPMVSCLWGHRVNWHPVRGHENRARGGVRIGCA